MAPQPNDWVADLRYVLDPVAFAVERLAFEPDPWQARVLRSRRKRQLLNCSRQSGKSTTIAGKALHAGLYRRKPNGDGTLTLIISPSENQSLETFDKVRGFLKRSGVNGKSSLEKDNAHSLRFATGARIVALPGSARTARGYSPDLLIVEEAAHIEDDENFFTAVRPMIAATDGDLILMSTPNGKRGAFYREWSEGGSQWERHTITAHECPRIKPEFIEEEKRSMGELKFRQEYLCEFVEASGQLFRQEDIDRLLSGSAAPLAIPKFGERAGIGRLGNSDIEPLPVRFVA
ncbi:MAG TPA: terminase large subunit [Stellaceae bacterium]|nr:terminase large subunit [Stellaceae bacterium]